MYRLFTLPFLLLLLPYVLYAQVLPRERSVLNYRLIGFSFPSKNKAQSYTLEIARGNFSSEDSFRMHIVRRQNCTANRVIAEVPSFGCEYTWRVVHTFGEAGKTATALYHFSTGSIPEVDTSIAHLRIVQPALKYTDAYVFLDDFKTLYDMSGNPVWYLPAIEGHTITPRDLKLSPQGTITFMYDPPYEVNYNGDVLWKAPRKSAATGENTEIFHHEFTRLSNGHYMVLGEDSAMLVQAPSKEKYNGAANKKAQFGTLLEYDEQGNVLWRWRSSDYFAASDLRYYMPPKNVEYVDVHENSFYFDEKNNTVYISFKNISRIIKVKYPEGEVINTYGEQYKPGGTQTNNGLFCGQHACKRSEDGNLYLFNNNSCDPTGLPRVVIMKETGTANAGVKKVWEYECSMDGFGKDVKPFNSFMSGGNVEELPDHSMLVCMSGQYCKIFIVSPDKKILWSAIPEWKHQIEKSWLPVAQYRASIIKSRKELERLIWNAEARPSYPVTAQALTSKGSRKVKM